MSSLRDLVTGSDVCTPSEGGPSNAMGSFVNNLMGGSSKTQEQLRELPTVHHGIHGPAQGMMSPEAAARAAMAGPNGMYVPGAGPSYSMMGGSGAQALAASIAGPSQSAGDWDSIFAAGGGPGFTMPPPGQMQGPSMHGLPGMMHPGMQVQPPGAPPAIVGEHLRRFFAAAARGSGVNGALANVPPLPPAMVASLTVIDKCRIRDRATILARHVFADQGEMFADKQVGNLLASLNISAHDLPASLPHAHDAAWHEAWGQHGQQGPAMAPQSMAADMAAAAQFEQVWNQQQGRGAPWQPQMGPGHHAMRPALSTGWADEFSTSALTRQQQPANAWASEFSQRQPQGGAAWASEFVQQPQQGGAAWASDFVQQQPQGGAAWAEEFATATATAPQRMHGSSEADAMRSTRALVDVLSRDADPKMYNSKFLQFVSKMSKGELMFADNKVVERTASELSRMGVVREGDMQQAWAETARMQGGNANMPGGSWANEFANRQGPAGMPGGAWANEFENRQGPAGMPGGAWANEFADRFAQDLSFGNEGNFQEAWQQAGPAGRQDTWVEEFAEGGDEETFKEWEQIYGMGKVEEALMGPNDGNLGFRHKGEYVFAANNPFQGDVQALAKGKDLFRRGVLSEAALALEAEVIQNPSNAEAWRLLGTVHAENDDDQQAIAAMLRALGANPNDLDALLSLGVSHVNELDTGEAVQHLATWLIKHPQYSQIANSFGMPPDSSQMLSQVVRMFAAAAAAHTQDAEVAVALGVLHHLNRQYPEAISAFETALKLRPEDYSLWNKLGATLANNARSAEAIHAYQKALDLKPNYMRAWTNMGISFANVGDYDRSARFYVRALSLNPNASHVWGYLRTSLACAGRMELMSALDSQQLATLAAALPME